MSTKNNTAAVAAPSAASATVPARPIPRENVYTNTAPYWEGVRARKLMLQYCTETKKYQYFPRPVSIYTGRRTLEWRESSGKGVIYACTVVRIPGPGLDGRLPLCIATVELDEGVRVLANILDCKPEDMAIGKRVSLAWDMLAEDKHYPAFVIDKN